jgi:Ecdysteroid kinase-like family
MQKSEGDEKVPEWLNKSLLQKALQSFKSNETIEILNFKIATGFSEHFASTMFQCKIVFKSLEPSESEPETLNVVIKAKPVNEGLKMDVVSQGPLFETEIKMYKETIPAINQLFKQTGLKVELGPE